MIATDYIVTALCSSVNSGTRHKSYIMRFIRIIKITNLELQNIAVPDTLLSLRALTNSWERGWTLAVLPLETDNPSMRYSVPVRQLNPLRFGYQSFSMTVVAEFFIYNGFLVRLVLPSSEPFLNLKNLKFFFSKFWWRPRVLVHFQPFCTFPT